MGLAPYIYRNGLVVGRYFRHGPQWQEHPRHHKTLNAGGIPTTNGKRSLKTTIHTMLNNEAYSGALVWGTKAKDNAPPVRVEDAFPAIVTKQEFRQIAKLVQSRAPKSVYPRRASSPYLLSGLLTCETCGKALTAAEGKSGR